ncbi:hypothetical protein D3C76_1472190 [compost metagenome]
MKQRIAIDQLNELSEDQKDRLQGLWKPQRGDMFFNTQNNFVLLAEAGDLLSKKDCLPLLSIGQMIEILQEYDRFVDIWYIEKNVFMPNLCDVLWDELKKIL